MKVDSCVIAKKQQELSNIWDIRECKKKKKKKKKTERKSD